MALLNSEVIDSDVSYCACLRAAWREIPELGLSAEQGLLRGCGAPGLFGDII